MNNCWKKCWNICIPKRIHFYTLLLCLNFFDLGVAGSRSFPHSLQDAEYFSILVILSQLTFVITAIPFSAVTRNFSAKDLIICFSSLKLFYWMILFRTNNVGIANIIAEFILGISLFLFCLTPIYVEEIAEAKDRGKIICIIFCTYWIIQMRIPVVKTVDAEAPGHISAIFYIFLYSLVVSASTFLLPHSPVWLLANGDETKARQSLEKLRGKGLDFENEINLIKEMLDGQEQKSQIGLITLIRSKRHLFKNIGIMIVIFFLREPVRTSNYVPLNDSMYIFLSDAPFMLGQILCCCIVECVRRKVLLLVSLSCTFSLLCMSIYALFNINNMVIYEIIYSINTFLNGLGLDLLPYVLMVELIPYPVRRIGVGISASFSFAFIIKEAYLFNWIETKYYLLYFSTIISGLGAVFIYYKMPETKGVANETTQNTRNTQNNSAIIYSRMGNEETGSVNIDI